MNKRLLVILPALALLPWVQGASAQTCPNGDFENWNVRSYSEPDSMWFTSNSQSLAQDDSLTVWKVPGFSGQAVHMQTTVVGPDTLIAYITNTLGDPTAGEGGVPYTQQPTAITGYYRYNLPANDSALIIVVFKKLGVPFSVNMLKIRNATGSVSTFTPFSIPLATLAIAPDSVVVAAASSNVVGTGIQPGSWLELDQVEFSGTGITQSLPGGSFDSWLPQTTYAPVGWAVQGGGPAGNGVSRSSIHYSGDYSVQLTSQPGGPGYPVQPAEILTGSFSSSGSSHGLPYTNTTDTLTGYYQYIPAGGDTAHIFVSLTAAGSFVGGSAYDLTSAATWTYFSMPINSISTPDSMMIDIQSSTYSATVPGSVLRVDHLRLMSQTPLGVNEVASGSVLAYPNPVNDVLNIRLGIMAGPVEIIIYDMTGRTIDAKSYNVASATISFPVAQLPGGIYVYEVKNNGNTTRAKFVKQ